MTKKDKLNLRSAAREATLFRTLTGKDQDFEKLIEYLERTLDHYKLKHDSRGVRKLAKKHIANAMVYTAVMEVADYMQKGI